MASENETNVASTPEATAAQAESREGVTPQGSPQEGNGGVPGPYALGEGITRADRIAPYERKTGDPIYRPLRIFTRDPATSLLAGAIALVNLPYEPLKPGPEGALFRVEGPGPPQDLDDPALLISNGATPSMSDGQFRKQMVYAVCTSVYGSFRAALGRYVAWGFDQPGAGALKLTIRPEAFEGENAFYEKRNGTLSFGFYKGDKGKTRGNNLPGGTFYTSLSHDVVAHEVTHALLDGLRSNFTIPTGPDVPAFHEALADLVAFFQRFSYAGVVRAAIREAGPNLAKSAILTNIAEQFGQTVLGTGALRTITEMGRHGEDLRQYGEDAEPHALGSVLTAAVFDAFNTIFRRKTEPLLSLATGGTGILPHGQMPADLQDLLAKAASKLASQFLSILIRSIDYCPPVDIRFGDFLRAMITADHDLVPDDPYAYREALIDAFRRRSIFPIRVPNLSEDALLWRPTRMQIEPIPGLNFASLRFRGDPQNAAGGKELLRQARCLADVICRPEYAAEFGLVSPGRAAQMGVQAGLPCIQSIRSSRRIGPDGQVAFDLVAEVTQRQTALHRGRPMQFLGGATAIIGPKGEMRYVISKSVTSESRMLSQKAYLDSDAGNALWETTRAGLRPRPEMLRLLHE
ncbi:MAG: hypothetical protein JWO80_5216 [Bryobacterales bacterium]|nr:hypothetical protein [Bryobacterales bacterium]